MPLTTNKLILSCKIKNKSKFCWLQASLATAEEEPEKGRKCYMNT